MVYNISFLLFSKAKKIDRALTFFLLGVRAIKVNNDVPIGSFLKNQKKLS